MNVTLDNCPSGWVLVKGRLSRHCQYAFPHLAVERYATPGHAEEVMLPVVGDGRIVELIELPDDAAAVVLRLPENERPREPGFSLRRVGLLERAVRMWSRVLRAYGDLSPAERREVGLTLRGALFDLPLAYRLATRHGPKLQSRPYAGWSARFNALSDQDYRRIKARAKLFSGRPKFEVLLAATDAGPDAVSTTLASLRHQLYRDFTCTILNDTRWQNVPIVVGMQSGEGDWQARVVEPDDACRWLAAFNASLAGERANSWVLLLRAGDLLPEHALYCFASGILAHPDAIILYSDDDEVDVGGRPSGPRFKPDWSLAHFRSTNYVGHSAAMSGRAVAAGGGVHSECWKHGIYDLLLRMIDKAGEKVAHIPAVLYHRRAQGIPPSSQVLPHGVPEDAWENPAWCASKLREHLRRRGVEADVSEAQPGCRRVRYRLPETPPLVSIIVPTRDALPLLRQCVDSVLEKTTYPRVELLIVDNQTADAEALAYLQGRAGCPSVRILHYDRPFNFSAINNFAARQARGDVLCLLNNDTEVISPDWLEEMVGHLLQAQVGAVGARLLYPDGRVQHGGVAVGPGGCADHLHVDLPRDHPGYCQRALIAQELSAVTGACMLTWKHLYERLGGFNEINLPVAFNDVDYCLRLQEAGYHVIYAAHAELFHHESATRGPDSSWRKMLRARREVIYMRTRWRKRMRHDPYYNLNLSYRQPNFSLNWQPRAARRWLRK